MNNGAVVSTLGGGPEHPVVVAPLESRFLEFPQDALLVEPGGGSPGATYPSGFLAGGVVAGLKDSGRPDMGVLTVAPEWRAKAVSAAVFTTNAFASAPVVVNRTDCDLQVLVAVGMNSGNANACTGEAGMAVARAMQKTCADTLGVPCAQVAVGSTGIIGVQLDASIVTAGMKRAALSVKPDGGAEFNRSIMTTDRFPKACALSVKTADGTVRLGGCVKGAGMIAPAMATMLCVVTTDALLTATEAQTLLGDAVAHSFNRITVDGEMSTNDSAFFLANGASGVRPGRSALAEIGAALSALLLRLALMMVADGEGATKIMRLTVGGADTAETAVRVSRAIAGSPLVKTAMHGADANWGRIISSAGAAMPGRSLPGAALRLCGVTVVSGGAGCLVSEADRERMEAAMKQPEVEIELDLGLGKVGAQLFFADMGHEYISINAEYHT
jgi:glutamate N-acetyltransferase/amino-acid N-acetyltransferase